MKDKTKLTPKQLSELWDVPLATLSQWRWNGKGPEFIKIGKHIKYRKEDVARFELENLRKDTTCKGFVRPFPEDKLKGG